MIETIHCLYCDTENTLAQGQTDLNSIAPNQTTTPSKCLNCGMPLPKCHPHSGTYRRRIFRYAFWPIALFCILMMIYLPR
jgi:hypothetical protein